MKDKYKKIIYLCWQNKEIRKQFIEWLNDADLQTTEKDFIKLRCNGCTVAYLAKKWQVKEAALYSTERYLKTVIEMLYTDEQYNKLIQLSETKNK